MDVASFCRQSRVLVVAGKGGVGKSTMVAALARMAANAGMSVLIVELEGKPGISAAFDRRGPLLYEESLLAAPTASGANAVRARRITPDDALLEYLADHGLHRVSKRLLSTGVLDVVATAIPGIRDVLVLGKVKGLERDRAADLILVDAPATGHAVTFLTSAGGLLGIARSGPVRTQAAEVDGLLRDPERCRVMLVTLAEEMPVSETVEAAYQLEDRAGLRLGPVIVNGVAGLPLGLAGDAEAAAGAVGVHCTDDQLAALNAARRFRLQRAELEAEQLARLGRELPLPQIRVPALAAPVIGSAQLDILSDSLARGVADLVPEVPAA
ncbi:MAG TPA: ArsA-related P-loop ATPase [Acidimicrobiales bacterium]|nr:ArsA-related P-loop ATPase [Acidimicrobiales bacterium]